METNLTNQEIFEFFVIIRSIRLIFGGIYADQPTDLQGV